MTTHEAAYAEVARLLAEICDVRPVQGDKLVATTMLEDDDGAGADELLAAINAALAPAYAADWTGDSNTDADGTTYSYVAIRRATGAGR
jgi:hypothetical protein